MRRAVTAWLCMLLAGAAASSTAVPAAAQQPAATVRHAGADTLTVAAGARGSSAFTLRNDRSAPLTVRIAFSAPPELRLVTQSAETTVPPGATRVSVAGFVVADDAPAGVYVLRAGADGGRADSVVIRVPARSALELHVREAPVTVIEGTPYTVSYELVNAGNVPAAVLLRLESAGDVPARLDSTVRRLQPGGRTTVRAEVRPPSRVPGSFVHALLLRASAAGPDTATAEATARVEILPEGRAGAQAARAGIPAAVRLRLSNDPRAGPPVRAHVSGPVRPGSATRVDMLLQGPASGYSMFGETDSYSFALQSEGYGILLGDHVYGLSPLTESGRYGFGVAGRAGIGPIEAGGYVQQDRRSLLADTQQAAFVHLRLGTPVRVGVNGLRSRGLQGPRDVASAIAQIDVPGWLWLEGEYGVRPAAAAHGHSVHVRAGGRPVAVNLRHMRTDSAYGGAYAGAQVDAAHISLRPWRQLQVEASLEDSRFDRMLLGIRYAHSTSTSRALLGYGSHISAEAVRTVRSTLYAGRSSERESRSARLRLGVTLPHLSLFPLAEVGTVWDRVENVESSFWKAGVHTQIRAGQSSASAAVEYLDGATFYDPARSQTVSASLSTWLRLGRSISVQLSGHGTRVLGGSRPRTTATGNGAIERRFGNGHLVAVRVRSRYATGFFAGSETITLIDYTIPFTVPTGRPRTVGGTVSGRIYDVETGMPLPRAVVETGGRRAVTDARGTVEFGGLEPGTYHLRIDRGSIGLQRVPAVPMPLALEVETGRRTGFEVGVIRSAAITARAILVSAPSLRATTAAVSPRDTVGVANALLELRSAGQRIRRSTAADGSVRIDDLYPGSWTVVVVHADLPPLHRLHSDSVVIELLPASDAVVTFMAAAVERRLQIIASGELTDRPGVAADTIRPLTAVRQDTRRPQPRVTPLGEPTRARAAVTTGIDERRLPGPVVDVMPPGWSWVAVHERETTLKAVAARVYGSDALWQKIWFANRHTVTDPDAVPEGLVLKIPPK